jgi:NTE family protein
VICGTSAGAVNATSLALSALDFREGVARLSAVWENAHVDQAYRSDPPGVLRNSLRLLSTLLLGGKSESTPVSMLDSSPLSRLLEAHLPFHAIQHNIESGVLHALGITAWGYTSGQSVTFYQGAGSIVPWKRRRRIGVSTRIGVEHLMASSAIPILFPPIRINREYFGDGSMRQLAPLSPALHLGAERVLVIGVRKPPDTLPERMVVNAPPTLAQIGGHILGSIFLDSLDVDLERLERINRTLQTFPEALLRGSGMSLRQVESMVISPSVEIHEIAVHHAHTLPRTIRLLYRAIGALRHDGSSLLSYVLFEEPFCRALIDLGYQDTMAQKSRILRFIGIEMGTGIIRDSPVAGVSPDGR